MSSVRKNEEALRDECERLAKVAESRMFNLDLPESERREAQEQARVYWQMSRMHADTVTYAADARPINFTAKNVGEQKKTTKRRAFLRSISEEIGTEKHEAVAAEALDAARLQKARSYWPKIKTDQSYKILNFLKKHGL